MRINELKAEYRRDRINPESELQAEARRREAFYAMAAIAEASAHDRERIAELEGQVHKLLGELGEKDEALRQPAARLAEGKG